MKRYSYDYDGKLITKSCGYRSIIEIDGTGDPDADKEAELLMPSGIQMSSSTHRLPDPSANSEKIPQVTFDDYLLWNEEEWLRTLLSWKVHYNLVPVKRPFTIRNVESYEVVDMHIKKTLYNRRDAVSLYCDIIVIAGIVARGDSRYELQQEWYRIRTIRVLGNRLQREDDIQITVYDPADACQGTPFTNCLNACLTNDKLDAEVMTMLGYYYDKALQGPCKIDARELAANMGYTVLDGRLTRDMRLDGRIVFEEMDLDLYDPDHDVYKTQTIGSKTILIDPAANMGQYYDKTADTIIHECVHAFENPFGMEFVRLMHDELGRRAWNTDLESLVLNNANCSEFRRVEWTARAMTPRLRMPSDHVLFVFNGYQGVNRAHFHNSDRATEKSIADTAKFFGTSKKGVKRRLTKLGNTDVNGILVYCNDGYLPRHSWRRHILPSQSYSIDRKELETLCAHEPELKNLLGSERLVYVDGFVCLNDPKYIDFGKTGRRMKPEALKDVSQCCLLFTTCWDDDEEFTYGVLNNIDKRGMAHATLSKEELSMLLNEATVADELPDHRRDDFMTMLLRHKDMVGMTERELSVVSTIEPGRLHNMLTGSVKKITVREVVALGLGLGMQPEEIFTLVDKSPAKFEDTFSDNLLQIMIKRKYTLTVPAFSAALVELDEQPLVEDWQSADAPSKKTRKKKTTATSPDDQPRYLVSA